MTFRLALLLSAACFASAADSAMAFGATPLSDTPDYDKPFDMDEAVEEAGHWQKDWGTAPPPPPHRCEDWCNRTPPPLLHLLPFLCGL